MDDIKLTAEQLAVLRRVDDVGDVTVVHQLTEAEYDIYEWLYHNDYFVIWDEDGYYADSIGMTDKGRAALKGQNDESK